MEALARFPLYSIANARGSQPTRPEHKTCGLPKAIHALSSLLITGRGIALLAPQLEEKPATTVERRTASSVDAGNDHAACPVRSEAVRPEPCPETISPPGRKYLIID